MPPVDFNDLLNSRSDPDARMVLEDAELSMGHRPVRLGVALSRADAATDEVATDDTTAEGAADAVAGDDTATDDAAGSAADDAADSGDAATDAAGVIAGHAANASTALLLEEIFLCNGLKIIQVTGCCLSVTRIGWVRRVSGDEYEIVNARTILRAGTLRTLDSLASDGPRDDHTLTPPAKATEELHRLTIRSSIPADVGVWAEHCPRPVGWQDG